MAEADDTAETTADELPKLPGYRIERVIGRGSTGVVYLAEDEKIERRVALKVVFPALSGDDVFRRRFERESRIAASLTHPNVVPVLGSGRAAGQMFITMPFMSGGDLRRLLETEGALGLERATAVIGAIGEALDAAHAQDMIHRDVKPANILIDGDGAEQRYYLSDFGIAKVMASTTNLTSTGQFLGTLDYISPEQIQSKAMDGRADLYSLGCVLHECLTGQAPFVRDGVGPMMFAHISDAPPSVTGIRPELPAGIDAVVAKALAKNPAERFASCGELTAALRQLIADPTSSPVSLSEAPTLTGAVSPTATAETLTGMVPDQAPVTSGMTSTYRAPVLPKAWEPPAAPAATTPSASPRIRLLAGALAAVIAVGLTVTGVAYAHNRFPTETEQSLIDQVPMAFKSTCTRNDDAEQDSDNVQASVICSPPNAEVNSYALTKYTSPTALEQQYRAAFDHAASATGPVADGDCASSDRANGTYKDDSGRANGHVLCYRQRGSSYLTWTDSGSQTLASATRYDPDQKKLREWWADVQGVKLTTPVAATQTPPEPLADTLLPPGAALAPPATSFSQKISAPKPTTGGRTNLLLGGHSGPKPDRYLLGPIKGIDPDDGDCGGKSKDDDCQGSGSDGKCDKDEKLDDDGKCVPDRDEKKCDKDEKLDDDGKCVPDRDEKKCDKGEKRNSDGDCEPVGSGNNNGDECADGGKRNSDGECPPANSANSGKECADGGQRNIAGDCVPASSVNTGADCADESKFSSDDGCKGTGKGPGNSDIPVKAPDDVVVITLPNGVTIKGTRATIERLKELQDRIDAAKRDAEQQRLADATKQQERAEAASRLAVLQQQQSGSTDQVARQKAQEEAARLAAQQAQEQQQVVAKQQARDEAARRLAALQQEQQQEEAKQAAQQQAQQDAAKQAAQQRAQQEAAKRAAEKQQLQQQQQAEAQAAKQAAQQEAQQEAANKQQAQQEAANKQQAQQEAANKQQAQQEAANKQQSQQEAQQEAAKQQAQQEAANKQEAQQQAKQQAQQEAKEEAQRQAEQEARQKAQEERSAAREAAQQAAQERAAERAAARQKAAQQQSTTTTESGTTSEATGGTSTGGTASQGGTGQTCTSEEVAAGTCTE